MKILEAIKNISNIIDYLKEKKDNKEDINKEFNDRLNNSNDTSFCDVVRKKKQQEIEDLKND